MYWYVIYYMQNELETKCIIKRKTFVSLKTTVFSLDLCWEYSLLPIGVALVRTVSRVRRRIEKNSFNSDQKVAASCCTVSCWIDPLHSQYLAKEYIKWKWKWQDVEIGLFRVRWVSDKKGDYISQVNNNADLEEVINDLDRLTDKVNVDVSNINNVTNQLTDVWLIEAKDVVWLHKQIPINKRNHK